MPQGIQTLVSSLFALTMLTCTCMSRHGLTRQSEMANTSPRHMPVIGNVHPIKIKHWIFFRDIIYLLVRIFIFLIDRATQDVPMKNTLLAKKLCDSSFLGKHLGLIHSHYFWTL